MPRASTLVTASLSAAVLVQSAGAVVIVFVHDQSSDQIIRCVDRNGDGDATDPGEATDFLDATLPVDTGINNAQGLVALGPNDILATDNFAPDNVVHGRDLNGDGDSLDPGEAFVWFDGTLPGGFHLTNPAELRARANGGYFILDNNTLDTINPEAIYALADADNSGVIEPSEVTLAFLLSPAGASLTTTFDVVEDNAGLLYALDITDPNQIESIDQLDPVSGTKHEWFDSVDLLNFTGYVLSFTVNELEYISSSDEVIFGASTLGGSSVILAATDRNHSGFIDASSEFRLLWSATLSADHPSTGSPRDFWLAADGSLFFTDALHDVVWRLIDRNGDGDYNDLHETVMFYDTAGAGASGLPTLSLPLSVTTWMCAADLAEPFGVLDLADVQAFIAAFIGQQPLADLNADGVWDLADVQGYIAAFIGGCP
ncbi:MAG: hypothetical protein H6810_06375 [Phycisphaeraceae bacterium]|nr:MAG: hypothetical protein H6810_06375 [Phycisphaeraceae bacterium]